MKLYIKNMICNRCKTTVKSTLEKLGIEYTSVELGEVNLQKHISSMQMAKLDAALHDSGFELINAVNNELIEKLKLAITDLENHSDEELKTSFSDYISLVVNENFISLNTLFSEIEGVTIEKYIIRHKIARVKELLVYDDLSLAEIAVKMHYSNQAQMSAQFKQITGLTPTHFRMLRHARISNPQNN